jgi:hypothetical protein
MYIYIYIYKGGNVLVDTGTVKLADFGASTKIAFGETQSTSTIKGSLIICRLGALGALGFGSPLGM